MYEDVEDASASAFASASASVSVSVSVSVSASAFVSDIDTKDFFDALTLLRSTDGDSTDKLRKMLDARIKKKLGFDETVRTRLPKRFYRNTTKPRERGNPSTIDRSEKRGDKLRKNGDTSKNNLIENDRGRTRIFVARTVETEPDWKPTEARDNAAINDDKLFDSFDEEKVDFSEIDDSNERDDIPRISIPDEGSGDGLVCKVCNGTKLGPLILLECQDCEEAYHPLCHQPPVVDVDVYDPRIVWHCNNCTDTVSTSPGSISNNKRTKKFYRRADTMKTKESSVTVDKFLKIKESPSKNDSTAFEETLSDTVRDIDGSTSNNHPVFLHSKDASLFLQNTKILSSNRLKKRIGSKLSVARVLTK